MNFHNSLRAELSRFRMQYFEALGDVPTSLGQRDDIASIPNHPMYMQDEGGIY
jgi:hypothetical protein